MEANSKNHTSHLNIASGLLFVLTSCLSTLQVQEIRKQFDLTDISGLADVTVTTIDSFQVGALSHIYRQWVNPENGDEIRSWTY